MTLHRSLGVGTRIGYRLYSLSTLDKLELICDNGECSGIKAETGKKVCVLDDEGKVVYGRREGEDGERSVYYGMREGLWEGS